MSLTGFLGRQSNFFIVGLSVLMILLIGVYDYQTGFEMGFSIFYLVPILLGTWYMNRRWGAALAFLSVVVWAWADHLSGHFYSHPLIPYGKFGLRFGSYLILVVFLSKLHFAFGHEKILSRTDHLTGVMNRGAFMNVAAIEIERARRHEHPFSIGFIDIDNFKIVNDRFGHKKGDTLLQLGARTIKGNIRNIDVLARLGGDEFIVLLPETGAASSAILFRRLKDKLLLAMKESNCGATFSFGVATFLKSPATVDEMIAKADHLMYAAKHGGKNMIKQEIFHD